MRFMIVVKATKDSEAGVMPHEKILGEMAKYHEELQKAGVLLDASGLIEVRQLFELDDFGPSEAVERFRKMDVG